MVGRRAPAAGGLRRRARATLIDLRLLAGVPRDAGDGTSRSTLLLTWLVLLAVAGVVVAALRWLGLPGWAAGGGAVGLLYLVLLVVAGELPGRRPGPPD